MIKKELKLNCNYLAAHLKFKRINNFIEQIYLSVTSSWTIKKKFEKFCMGLFFELRGQTKVQLKSNVDF